MRFEPFENIFKDSTSNFIKVKKEDYNSVGIYPIVDQGQAFIGGYTNNEKLVVKENLPVIIFGDHTKIFKYVDFPFTIGADGVKVLSLKNIKDNVLFYYYYLKSINIVDKGYSRHFKYLKEKKLPVFDNAYQLHIANLLSKAETLISQRKESLRLLDEYLKSTFLEMFGDPILNSKKWPIERLDKISKLERGRFSPRPRNDPSYFNGDYPFIQTGDISKSGNRLSSFTQTLNEKGIKVSKKFNKGTIVIAIVGATIGATAILEIEVYATDSIIGITPKKEFTNSFFLEFNMQFWKPILLKNAPEAARANINLEILNKLNLIAPPLELQTQFAQIVEKTEALKTQYQQSLQELENLYSGLTQKAFRGELGSRNTY
jgi:type I restriction enzyme, S subunit